MNNQLNHPTPDRQPVDRPQKQPYAAPALKKMGTVQELTQGSGTIVLTDNLVASV